VRSSCHPEPQDLQDQPKKDFNYGAGDRAFESASKRSHTKLGDFGALWELLSGPSTTSITPATVTANPKPEDTQTSLKASPAFDILKRPNNESFHCNSIESSALLQSKPSPVVDKSKSKVFSKTGGRSSKRPPQTITILQRGPGHESTGTDTKVKFDTPRTPAKPIAGAGNQDTPKARTQHRGSRMETRRSISNGAYSSENSAEAESDSSFIFDRPTPQRSGVLAFVPSQIGTPDPKASRYDTPPSSFEDQYFTLNANNIAALGTGSRVQSIYKSSTECRVFLVTKLLKEFPEYANIVSSAGQSGIISPRKCLASQSIHIFVDISNVCSIIPSHPSHKLIYIQIMVGFHDAVKQSRNISLATRIRRVHMSFANLALIMERGRHAAKKVLVGSDRLPSIDEAETLGYEANILDRVHKFKHTTPRRNKSRKIPGSSPQKASGGPEMVAPSGERWVEQGVDEILHLKILESLLDTDEPATIVLATGDAAVAEFSGGFMRMVERALKRGWCVELVSFTQVTSYAYRNKGFRAKWGDRFKLIELDTYIEELFE
jgi:hypothetical protein